MRRGEASPFDAIEEAFAHLTQPPRPLSIDGTKIGDGWPQRPIPMD